MASKLYRPVSFCLIIFLCFLLFFSHVSAKQCSCEEEIQDLEFHLESDQFLFNGFMNELGKINFPDLYGESGPADPNDLQERVGAAYANAGINRQHRPTEQIPPDVENKMNPIGNRKLFRNSGYVNPLCWIYYCDISCQLVQKHEQQHDVFDRNIFLPTFLYIQTFKETEYVAESEVDAYRYQISLTKDEIEKRNKQCQQYEYECEYTGTRWNNAVSCVNNCHQSLLHFGKLCREIDKKTGEYTGYGY